MEVRGGCAYAQAATPCVERRSWECRLRMPRTKERTGSRRQCRGSQAAVDNMMEWAYHGVAESTDEARALFQEMHSRDARMKRGEGATMEARRRANVAPTVT